MRIGIFIDNRSKQIGGGYSYTKTLIDFISTINGRHQFIFIISTIDKDLPQELSHLVNYVLYNPYNTELKESIAKKNLGIIKSLRRLIRLCNFLVDRVRLNSFVLIRDILMNRISRYEDIDFKDRTYFKKLIKKENISCVYYPMALTCEDSDVPFYTTIWDLGHLNISVFPEVSINGEFELRQNILNTLVHKAHRIVAESKSGKEDICFYYNTKPDKVIVVPQFPSNLIDIVLNEGRSNDILEKFGLTPKKYLFYPAQFWPHKNHINLIKALSALKNESVTIDLILTGSDKGNYEYVMNYLNSTSVRDQVRYLGFVSDDEMKVLYTNALALVFPTLLGPTNMPIVEAIACGCPVICSDFVGHREQAGEAALYFNPGNYLDIMAKIKIVIEDETLRMKLIRNGKDICVKNNIREAFVDLLISFDEFENIRCTWGN